MRAALSVDKLVDLMGIQMVATLGLNWVVRKVVKTADVRVVAKVVMTAVMMVYQLVDQLAR